MLRVVVLALILVQLLPPLYGEIRGSRGKKSFFPNTKELAAKESRADYWHNIAQDILQKAKAKRPITNVAKNVILFMGDGMSVPTVTASRIYVGGESNLLSFEKFPYTAVSKTYNVDRLVSESASTATAYLGGVKSNRYTAGVTAAVKLGDCKASLLPENQVPSIASWSQKAGKWTGFVTTTRVTHASPAGFYAHIAHKEWECDSAVAKFHEDPEQCPDIAKQLVHDEVGRNLRIILGCGRNMFLPKEIVDEEGMRGQRSDKKNLIEEWKAIKKTDNKQYEYVWNREQLVNVKDDTEYLFGLFDGDMCKYNVDRKLDLDPSLEEMTQAAIDKLSKSPKGYFLFVEGGMIDQAHHSNLAGKALDETAEFAKAISKAVEMTDEKDTLIVVTADHSHTMNIAGYPERGADILAVSNFSDVYPINEPIPILSYANGPGYKPMVDGGGYNFTADKIDMNYKYPVLFKTSIESHGGDDVLIYAKGPWAHLFEGVMEQNAIPHFIAYASCIGSGSTACKDGANYSNSGASSISYSTPIILYFFVALGVFYSTDRFVKA